jgi:galactokinase
LNKRFEREFGRAPQIAATAPGRVNVIGEHTDYNGGFMLPVALPHRTHVRLCTRADRIVRVRSIDLANGSGLEQYVLGSEQRGRGWLDYVQGVTEIARPHGRDVAGFDLLISSEVPIGKGLSSSASLQVSVLRALNDAWELDLDGLDIATIAHRAETDFVGAPVGMMDQMASSLGDETAALLIDAATLAFERVPIPAELELAVLDSGISHDHATGEYRVRRRECEEAAAALGAARLRELSTDDLTQLQTLPGTLARRARHVITENARVLDMVRAFREHDSARAGELLRASHRSLRDDFEVSVPDIDRLVELANADPDVLGARMTGGGFGGAVVALCGRTHAARAGRRIVQAYRALTRRSGAMLLPRSPA